MVVFEFIAGLAGISLFVGVSYLIGHMIDKNESTAVKFWAGGVCIVAGIFAITFVWVVGSGILKILGWG